MYKKITLTALLLTLILPAAALGKGSDKAQRIQWMKEVRNYKYEFFTKEMELTAEQQEAFFPEYEAMEKAIFTINKEARDLERKISASTTPVSDTEYEAAATAMAKVRQEEGEIEMEYFAKFGKILSKKQLFLLKRAENKFTQSILNHHKRAGRE